LAQSAGLELRIDVPYMITAGRLRDIIALLLKDGTTEEDSAIIFETMLVVTQHQAKASLYLLFSKRLVDLLNNNHKK
jgi:hypothetical protein